MDGSVRVGPLRAIPHLLQEMGVDPADVASQVGIDLSHFDDPENTIPFAVAGPLLQECVVRTACPHFGLLVGARARTASLGVLGLLMQHSPAVGTALRNLVLYLQVQDRGAIPTLTIHDELALLGYAVFQRGVVATEQIHDLAIAVGCNILRDLCGGNLRLREVLLRRAQPADLEPYRRFFRAPLRFNSDQTALVFPATWLERPVCAANTQLYRILETEVEALMEQLHVDFASRARRVLHGLVITGSCSVEQAAFLFGMHRRTLNRRLAAQGTSFKDLLQDVRFEIAQQLLRDTHISVVAISEALGYTAAGAFTRAFRRWSGQAPADWRAEHQQA
jgi:AraC-like DNA-binding protein